MAHRNMIMNSGAIAEAAISSQCRGFMKGAATPSYCKRNAYQTLGPLASVETPCRCSLGSIAPSSA